MSIITKTFRYKTENLLQEELEYFAKVHQFDDKKSLKENFKKWLEQENISKLLEEESQRLESLQYRGNLHQKLFVSLKYYHIKNLKKSEPEIKTIPSLVPPTVLNETANKTRKQKQKNPVELLQKIEKHILFMTKPKNTGQNTEKTEIITISPNDAFKDYLVNEMAVEKDEEVIKKIKKIYKNKMFHLQRKLTSQSKNNTNNDTRNDDNNIVAIPDTIANIGTRIL